MKHLCLLLLAACCCLSASAQLFVDTAYGFTKTSGIIYSTARDFAGNERNLLLDLYLPDGDTPPPCGRPLMIVVHGGAWMTGSRTDALPAAISRDFAKRGYATASIDYRMGMFHTSQNLHCNLPNWDCMNMADTAEWIRANYRAMQDVRDAINYLLQHTAQTDRRNVFIVGESAGAFAALAAGYTDHISELMYTYQASLPDAPAPHSNLEQPCIVAYGLDTSIASMNLKRPDLGSPWGNHPNGQKMQVQGVGSFYGGVFVNLFHVNEPNPPALYLFHQPNDLLVPYGYDRLAAGLNYCATTMGGCAHIINRPYIYGGKGISQLAANKPGLSVLLDTTSNNADCLAQVLNPSTTGHAVDNYWLRTSRMAQFFAAQIDSSANCNASVAGTAGPGGLLDVYPNPATDRLHIQWSGDATGLSLLDARGRLLHQQSIEAGIRRLELSLPANLNPGLYILRLSSPAGMRYQRVMVR